ncbi:MAG: class I SAM-dependent methyltransferase [Nanoarchaeota archaeon]|nr:class I SAM-dependent methyltransferase [Nanoarchaeota archaeon]
MNKVLFYRPKLKDLLRIKSDSDFQSFLVKQSMKLYEKVCREKGKGFGKVLAPGSRHVEARNLPRFPFKKIILLDVEELDEATKNAIDKTDKRISHIKQNLECLDLQPESYDLVFCKETLHHLPRPVLGLYEMLRVCKNAVIIIEPYETFIGNILEKFNLSTKYEGDPKKEPKKRGQYKSCYVYRWNEKELIKILNSYYLKSGYELYLTNFWLSNRFGISKNTLLKILGWIISFLPFNRGNFMIALIVPGNSLPPEIKKV